MGIHIAIRAAAGRAAHGTVTAETKGNSMGAKVMEASTQNIGSAGSGSPDDALKESIASLNELVNADAERLVDDEFFGDVSDELGVLHARFRTHAATDMFGAAREAGNSFPPELTDDLERLRSEHQCILGQLDWLARRVEWIAQRSLEDKDVFILRSRELIAVLNRHVAEEDRLFYLALWRDTGGEG
jgi:hypothetical protein